MSAVRQEIERRAWCARAAAAAWGLALAAALAGSLQRPAPAGQLPGSMKALGLDANGPFLVLAALIAVPFAAALAAAPLARRVAGAPGWQLVAFCAALGGAPLLLLQGGGLAAVLLLGAIAAAVALFGAGGRHAESEPKPEAPPRPGPLARGPAWLARGDEQPATAGSQRALRAGFSRADLLLVPTAVVCYFAMLDLAPAGSRPATWLACAVAVTLLLRAAAGRLGSARRPGLAMAPAPLAILLQLQWLPARPAAIAALAWIAAAPLATALLLRTPAAERRLRAVVALAVYPLFVLAYPVALLGIDSPVSLDFFEDGHELLPAAEMLHGRRPYADIVPTHGLLSDGALDLLAMTTGGASTGDVLRVRRVTRCLVFPAIYAVAFAATGAAEAGLLAALLSLTLFPGMGLRPVPALLVLAAAAAATRRRSPRLHALAGAGAVLAFLGSPDFAACSAAVAALAAARMRLPRMAARSRFLPAGALAAGAIVAAALVLAVFAAMGFAGAFLRVTFVELPRAGQGYVIGPFAAPECMRTLGAAAAAWVQPPCVTALVWLLAIVAAAAGLARAPLAAARGDGAWLIGLWVALAGVAYAERRHLYASFGMAAFVVSALYGLARRRPRRRRGATPALAMLALVIAWLANPLGHLFGLATPLRARGGAAAAGVEISSIPRCRGVRLDVALQPAIAAVERFAAASLRPAETWLDFTDHPILYYLFDRRCPMRHQEIPFVESPAAQREVVAMLERDRSVRAVLVAFPDWFTAIDGVPNPVRAPLLWRYLQRSFTPAFDDHGVVFWTRR